MKNLSSKLGKGRSVNENASAIPGKGKVVVYILTRFNSYGEEFEDSPVWTLWEGKYGETIHDKSALSSIKSIIAEQNEEKMYDYDELYVHGMVVYELGRPTITKTF